MSTQNKGIFESEDITRFYLSQLNEFGDSSKGVGWKNDEAQDIRFSQLVKVLHAKEKFTINDLGCGTGKFYDFLVNREYKPTKYFGYDILYEMISAAENKFKKIATVALTKISSSAELKLSDYTVCSGIFNVKCEASEAEWLNYVLSTIHAMNSKSVLGFAFNMLTKYADKEFMQKYLYYADPLFYFDFCKRNYSKNVALLHDYDQYDFTIIVKK